MALTSAPGPSVFFLLGVSDPITDRVAAILDVLPRVVYELSQGAVVVIEEDRYRIRYLPIVEA